MTFPSEAKVLDFNSPVPTGVNAAINMALDASGCWSKSAEARRDYLGASGIGSGMPAQGAV